MRGGQCSPRPLPSKAQPKPASPVCSLSHIRGGAGGVPCWLCPKCLPLLEMLSDVASQAHDSKCMEENVARYANTADTPGEGRPLKCTGAWLCEALGYMAQLGGCWSCAAFIDNLLDKASLEEASNVHDFVETPPGLQNWPSALPGSCMSHLLQPLHLCSICLALRCLCTAVSHAR